MFELLGWRESLARDVAKYVDDHFKKIAHQGDEGVRLLGEMSRLGQVDEGPLGWLGRSIEVQQSPNLGGGLVMWHFLTVRRISLTGRVQNFTQGP